MPRIQKKQKSQWDFVDAVDVKDMLGELVEKLGFSHIKLDRIFCVRSNGSTTRAYARVWGLSRIFQVTAGFAPTYVIEVLSQHFDKLNKEQQKKVLIHELLHIPKTFSGALLSHRGRYHRVNDRAVEQLYNQYIEPKKKLWKILMSIVIFGVVFFRSASGASAVGVESIQRYATTITIEKTGALSIREEIVYDFGTALRHGIRRWVPLALAEGDKELRMKLSDVRVYDENNNSIPYSTKNENGVLLIQIGDADKTISGVHTYNIIYTISGGMRYFSERDELYWNAIGEEWTVPILEASVEVIYPENVQYDVITYACFSGEYGANKQTCEINRQGSAVIYTPLNPLNIGEGMTVVLGMPAGSVGKILPQEYVPFSKTPLGEVVTGILNLGLGALIIFWYALYPVWIVYKWYKYGRDPNMGVDVTAYFEGPRAGNRVLLPGETGGLIDEVVHERDIIATIVDLARRGYIKIEEREREDFYVIRQFDKPVSELRGELFDYETNVLRIFFKYKSTKSMRVKDIKDVAPIINTIKDQIYTRMVQDGLINVHPERTRNFYYGMTTVALFTLNFPLALIAFVFGRATPQKTFKGAKAAHMARGLKNFLNSQERQLNFQGDKQLLFEKLLPYAIAFGVEDHWIERFEAIGIESPQWYAVDSTYRGNSFVRLSRSFNNFAAITMPVVTYTHKSSYSSSGFSGGFSGGGGGGGGGGSW